MAVSQSLKLTEVSYNESDNTSKVRILWQSTQTGESRNEYTRTAYYYVSINGGAETKYSVSYTLPRGTTKTIVDSTITVNHRSDGTGTVAVRTWMDTDISAGVVELDDTIELTKIGRASIITSASAVVLGEQSTTIKWTPASSFHAYKIVLKIGAWGWTSEMISPRRTTEYAWKSPVLSLDLASEIPGDTRNGEMEAILYTFESASSTAIIGSSSKLFSVTVPKDSLTIPTARLTIQPVNSLRAPFDSMYLQGFS